MSTGTAASRALSAQKHRLLIDDGQAAAGSPQQARRSVPLEAVLSDAIQRRSFPAYHLHLDRFEGPRADLDVMFLNTAATPASVASARRLARHVI